MLQRPWNRIARHNRINYSLNFNRRPFSRTSGNLDTAKNGATTKARRTIAGAAFPAFHLPLKIPRSVCIFHRARIFVAGAEARGRDRSIWKRVKRVIKKKRRNVSAIFGRGSVFQRFYLAPLSLSLRPRMIYFIALSHISRPLFWIPAKQVEPFRCSFYAPRFFDTAFYLDLPKNTAEAWKKLPIKCFPSERFCAVVRIETGPSREERSDSRASELLSSRLFPRAFPSNGAGSMNIGSLKNISGGKSTSAKFYIRSLPATGNFWPRGTARQSCNHRFDWTSATFNRSRIIFTVRRTFRCCAELVLLFAGQE